jgi:hypothetical protein
MKLINEVLKFVKLTWVIRNRHNLGLNLNVLDHEKEGLLIFNYLKPKEKILFKIDFRR